MPQVVAAFPNDDKATHEAELRRALSDYQNTNTWFWDLIEESIDLTGAYEKLDRLERKP